MVAYFPHDIFKCIFLNQNARISIKISWMLHLFGEWLVRRQAIIWTSDTVQVTTNSTDAYMRQSASMSSGPCKLSSGRYQIVDILERIAWMKPATSYLSDSTYDTLWRMYIFFVRYCIDDNLRWSSRIKPFTL